MTLTEPGGPATPASHAAQPGYGNIYTPHAGSMIIQVQRESGLQSRTIVLTPRQVRVLRFFTSRTGRLLAGFAAVLALMLVVEAARVPELTHRISRMDHTAQRLDTLERSLSELQKRYDQVRTMMGVDVNGATSTGAPVAQGFVPAASVSSPRMSVAGNAAPIGAPSDGAASTDDATDTVTSGALGSPAAPAPRMRRARHPRAAATTESGAPAVVPPAPDSGALPSPQADEQ